MDLEEEGWVSVPCDGLLEVHDDGHEKSFSRKYVRSPTKVYKQNYFDKAPQEEKEFDHKEEVKEIIKLPIMITEPKETSVKRILEPEPKPEPKSDQDPIFQVFYTKESQYVEMNVGPLQYEEKNDDHVVNCSSPSKMINKEEVAWKESNEKFINIWKWGLNGIGGVCSLGMAAAATICIIIYVNGRRHKQQKKLKFQIHPNNKRINQVVQKANEAMSAVRGVPLVNAQITHGGHYESL